MSHTNRPKGPKLGVPCKPLGTCILTMELMPGLQIILPHVTPVSPGTFVPRALGGLNVHCNDIRKTHLCLFQDYRPLEIIKITESIVLYHSTAPLHCHTTGND